MGTLKVGCSELLNILQNRLMAVGIPLMFNVHSIPAKKLHFPHCSKYLGNKNEKLWGPQKYLLTPLSQYVYSNLLLF